MYIITMKNGRTFAVDRAAPQVAAIPFRSGSRQPTIQDLETVITSSTTWDSLTNITPTPGAPPKPRLRGVQAFGNDLSIHFIYPDNLEPAEALLHLEKVTPGFLTWPSALGLLIAARSKVKLMANYAITLFCAGVREVVTNPTLNRPTTREGFQQYFEPFFVEPAFPANWTAVDIARFLWQFGAWLWTETGRQTIVKRLDQVRHTQLTLSLLAAAYAATTLKKDVTISGRSFSFEPGEAAWTWPQLYEFERGRIPVEAISFLFPGENIVHGNTFIDQPAENGRAEGYSCRLPQDATTATSLAENLLGEAAINKQYVPLPGSTFLLKIPNEYILSTWNVSALRIYTTEKGLWVAPVDDKGHSDTAFYWDTSATPRMSPLLARQAAPLLDVTLAAIWHDLHVGGHEAFPVEEIPRRNQGGARSRPESPTSTSSQPHIRILPGKKYQPHGRLTWGTAAERKYIITEMSKVRGHPRRLLPGHKMSLRARKEADKARFFVVPAGKTFVKAHIRPGTQTDNTEEVPVIKVMGLASAMVFLK